MQRIKTGTLIYSLIDDPLDVVDFSLIAHLRSGEEHFQTFLDGFNEFFPTGHCRWGQGTSQLAGHELRSRPTHSPLVERHGSEGHRN